MVPSVLPHDLIAELNSPHPPIVIDVREDFELDISRIPYPVVHIPMGQLSMVLASMDKTANYAVLCRVGGRSAQAVMLMLSSGFENVRNIEGGINLWSEQVDPAVRAY